MQTRRGFLAGVGIGLFSLVAGSPAEACCRRRRAAACAAGPYRAISYAAGYYCIDLYQGLSFVTTKRYPTYAQAKDAADYYGQHGFAVMGPTPC